METNMKPQIQSTVYPEIPCSNFNEWVNHVKKEIEKCYFQGKLKSVKNRKGSIKKAA
jgi:hypothetical protein